MVFCSNRQDVIEALQLVARGKVKCQYEVRSLNEVNQWVKFLLLPVSCDLKFSYRVLKDLEEGKIVGRVVLKI